jgi:hypothetical protein
MGAGLTVRICSRKVRVRRSVEQASMQIVEVSPATNPALLIHHEPSGWT